MRTSARPAYSGRWSRSVTDRSPTEPFAVDGVAVSECCTASSLASWGGGSKPRIKSLSGTGPQRFVGIRAAGHTASIYQGELGRTEMNCNPPCKPWPPQWDVYHTADGAATDRDSHGSRTDWVASGIRCKSTGVVPASWSG